MTAKSYTWNGSPIHLPDGHRLFVTDDDGYGSVGYALADESGATPEATDDGVLWLDPTRCLRVGGEDKPNIPLLTEDGTETRTITDCATILYLSKLQRWTIEDVKLGAYYEAR